MATTKVTSDLIGVDEVKTVNILDANVTTAKVADNAITLAKLAHGTDGNLITYDAAGAPAAVATGTAGQVLTSGGAGVAPTMQTPGLPAGFTSSEQTVTADTLLNVAHGLGAIPSLFTVSLKCTDAGGELGYAQNDEVLHNSHMTAAADNGITVAANATNVVIVQGDGISFHDLSTFNEAAITTSKWKWIVRAWA